MSAVSDQPHSQCVALLQPDLKSHKYYQVTEKLELQLVEGSRQQTLIGNNYTEIMSCQLHFSQFHNLLVVEKRTGLARESLLLTSNQVVVHKEEYQHNILLKMAEVARVVCSKD